MKIQFGKWKMEMVNNVFRNVSYENVIIANELCLANEGVIKPPPNLQVLFRNNDLSPMQSFLNNEEIVASFKHNLKTRAVWKQASKVDLETGRLDIKRSYLVTSDSIKIEFKYKGKWHGYNNIFPYLDANEKMSSMLQLKKVQRKWHKEKISSQKRYDLDEKYPIIVSFSNSKNVFLLKTSTLTMVTKKSRRFFYPLANGKERKIVNAWRVKPNVYFHIAFAIEIKPDKWKI